MAVAASLNVLLTADTARFTAGMKKAEGNTKTFQTVTTKAAAGLGVLKTALASVAVVATAKKLGGAFVGVVNKIDDAADAAERLGISFQSMKTFEAISTRQGLDAQTMTNAMEKMSVTLGNARNGAKEAQAAFDKLGLGGIVSGGADNETAFLKTIEALNRIEDASVRAAAQQAIFGKGAKGLGDIMSLTTAQFEKSKASMIATGQILSETQLKAVLDNKAAIDKMAEAWDRATTSMAAYVAPTVTARLVEMAALIDGMQGRMTLGQMMGGSTIPENQRSPNLAAEMEELRKLAPGTTVDRSFKVVNGGMRSRPFQGGLEQFSGKTIFAAMTKPFEAVARNISDSAEKMKAANKREFDESVARISARKAQEAKETASRNSVNVFAALAGGVASYAQNMRENAMKTTPAATSISAGSQADALFSFNRQQENDQAKILKIDQQQVNLLQQTVTILRQISSTKPQEIWLF